MGEAGALQNGYFAAHRVDGIHHIAEGGKIDGADRFGQDEEVVRRHAAAGGEEGDALFGRLHLAHPERLFRREHLAVAVGEGDAVSVEEVEGADARAGEGLCAVSAHAAQPEHRHAGCGERFHRLLAEQGARAGEAFAVVVVVKCVHGESVALLGAAVNGRRSNSCIFWKDLL